MQEPQEAATKTESQRHRSLRLKGEGRIVQLQLGKGITQLLVLRGVNRIEAGEHHRLDLFKSPQHAVALTMQQGYRITHLGISNILDTGNHKPHFTGSQLRHFNHNRRKDTHLQRLVSAVGGHQLNLVPFFQGTFKQTHQDNNPLILVIPGIKQQCLQRGSHITLRGWNLLDDLLKDLTGTDPLFGRGQHRIMGVNADDLLNLVFDPLRLGSWQVDLVQYRKDLQVIIQRQIDIGQGLGLNPLGGIHHQQTTFTGRQRAGDLIGKVNMSRRINQIQDILITIISDVGQTNGLGLDGDTPFPFKIHFIQKLVLHLTGRQRAGILQESVSQG